MMLDDKGWEALFARNDDASASKLTKGKLILKRKEYQKLQKKHYKVLARNDDASAFTTDKGKTNSKEKRSQLTKEKEFNKLASSKLR